MSCLIKKNALYKSLYGICLLISLNFFAQKPHYVEKFEYIPNAQMVEGIEGEVLDLSSSAAVRQGLRIASPIKGREFSVMIWVKGEQGFHQSYEMLATTPNIEKKNLNDSISGWSMGVQDNGAWYWKGNTNHAEYKYYPITKKQSIRDGDWHLLAFTFSQDKKEIRFYYDGLNKAIYYVPKLTAVGLKGDSLYIGGKPFRDIDRYSGYVKMNQREIFPGFIDELSVYDEVLSADYIAKSYERLSPGKKVKNPELSTNTFKVMNFNIRMGGRETGAEVGIHRVAEVIRKSGADIVTMQETYGSGIEIAERLGFYFYLRGSNLSIMSRYPIGETLEGYQAFNNGGAYIRLKKDFKIAVFTNWFYYPVDYWGMIDRHEKINVPQLMQQIDTVTTKEIRETVAIIKPYLENANIVPVVFSGDFNSGSHLDYTQATRKLNAGYIFPFTTSLYLQSQGFIDSFREIHPNPLQDRGITWSPMFPKTYQERIDFIYYKGGRIKAINSETITAHPIKYPSDHAAVVTTFKIEK